MTATATPHLPDFVDDAELDALVTLARREDLGPDGIDVTSELFVPESLVGDAAMVSRAVGKIAGVALLPRVAAAYDPKIAVRIERPDGHAVSPGDSVARFTGPMRSILAMERVALNLVTHLSGVATLTSRFVEKTVGTRASIYDTRKTLPGLRGLQKYAVACGGGRTHRIGLYDAMLIKDNHLAHVRLTELAEALTAAAEKARAQYPGLKFVEVEVDSLDQLERALASSVDIVLLDNMGVDDLREAVSMRDRLAPAIELEASGGVDLHTVEAIARTGVDRISVGALTHSAPHLDLGLDIA